MLNDTEEVFKYLILNLAKSRSLRIFRKLRIQVQF
jgi:hypothetical protein